jgi:hypothetical protein
MLQEWNHEAIGQIVSTACSPGVFESVKLDKKKPHEAE